MEEKEEWKQINDWAIAAGRALQSPQTGLVHYCVTALPEDPQHTIPVYENLLFSLALMRSRLGDAVTEGKCILERMLAFQGPEGNFPIYLHEYPHSRDRFLGAYLLPPLYWIAAQFHAVLGQSLRERLDASALALLKYALNTQAEFDIPCHLKAKIGASAIAFGRTWKNSDLEARGEKLLASLPLQIEDPSWASPAHLADLLTALHMICPELGKSPYAGILEQLSRYWHVPLCASIHPGLKELQAGNEPQPTFLDVWMGYLSKINPKRIQQKSPYMLQGALIHSSSDHLPVSSYPCRIEGISGAEKTLTVATEKYAYTVQQQRQLFHPSSDRGRHSFRLIWGSPAFCHTFVLEGGNIAALDFIPAPEGIDLIVALGDPIQDDDREKNREIVFYADLHEDLRMAINGKSGTVFNLNDLVSVADKDIAFSLQFSLLEGEGDFIGHLMRGNRPTQLKDKGVNKFTSYDQQIILRTLRRTNKSKFCIKLTMK